MISIIIPAYNEASVITRTLKSVAQALTAEPGEIIVVCNGCRDETFDIASSFGEQVRVFNIEQGSKIAALNLGDEQAQGFPRFFLDADIELSPNALHDTSKVLREGRIHAAAPRMKCNTAQSSWMVRSFYRTWLDRPYHRLGHVGSGFVGISEIGRSRFEQFPNIIADDEFVRRQFTPQERAVIDSATFTIRAPHDVRSLIKVKTRARLGTLQLNATHPELQMNAKAQAENNRDSVHSANNETSERNWIDKAAYGFVVLTSRYRARRQFARAQFTTWERDETSRQ
ncbi:glycosyltransferase [Aureliella helgolandensis]|uniref:Putative glycosyl transferase n=1 Tax=Aureliella helgolandensis TaxID=2527968 RepID=A0A518GFE0_9BACT|nr:glycosyltransferase family A protein [Aureliella helgolandensis]QDV27314.1 putative glycosyl transferase [Aureliella helgolandensis]